MDHLSTTFAALADPTRRAILARLAEGDLTVTQLQEPFRISQPAISRHLKVLEQAGLITRTRRATARLSHLEATPLKEASDWLTRYREYWEESYARLDELLERIQAAGGHPVPPVASEPATRPATPSDDDVHERERSAP